MSKGSTPAEKERWRGLQDRQRQDRCARKGKTVVERALNPMQLAYQANSRVNVTTYRKVVGQ
jgi:hypothetical protein